MIRPFPIALLLLLPSCAAADGEWPSLARRPGEVAAAAAPAPAAPAAEAPVDAGAGTAADTGAAAVAAGRIAEAARDFEQVAARWERQRGETQTAVAAARGAAASSPAWARAQLELTRLERLGADLADLRDRLDAVAGDLALATSRGGDVRAVLGDAGALIGRIETARADHQHVFDEAQRALSR